MWAPLHNHTHYSLVDAISKPAKIAKRCADQGYSAVAMTDHNNVGCAVDFITAMKAVGIKPLLGCEFNICQQDPSIQSPENTRPYSHATVLAKNLAGWQELIRAVSMANSPECAYYTPRLSVERFAEFTTGQGLLGFSGHPGTDLANCIFTDPRAAYSCDTYQHLKDRYVRDQGQCQKELIRIAEQYVSIFGKGNFFLEVMHLDDDTLPACRAIAAAMRWLGKKLGIPCVAIADSHYPFPTTMDAMDHRVILCSMLKTTLKGAAKRLNTEIDPLTSSFFRSNKYHIPAIDEIYRLHAGHEQEVDQACRIADMCEEYDILRGPMLPTFPCPDGMSPDTYLRKLCQDGWADKVAGRVLDRPISEYEDRLEMELRVIKEAGLPSYFLMVQDYMNFGRSKGWLLGPGRGSAAGCLVSYLTNITGIDPLPYGLLFERFYNAGRSTPGRISLPDIDCDFPISKRELVFLYLQMKYGADKVAKIATFNSLKGRGALSEVFRAREISYDLAKQITKIIPEPARISEELQEMREHFTDEEKASGKEPSIIEFTLDLYRDELSEWVHQNDDGSLDGDLAICFEQAIRLEGIKKNISTHAAGVVVSSLPLAGLCPIGWDSVKKTYRADMEYPALEAQGLVKLDLLGVGALDKGEYVRDLVRTGRIGDDD